MLSQLLISTTRADFNNCDHSPSKQLRFTVVSSLPQVRVREEVWLSNSQLTPSQLPSIKFSFLLSLPVTLISANDTPQIVHMTATINRCWTNLDIIPEQQLSFEKGKETKEGKKKEKNEKETVHSKKKKRKKVEFNSINCSFHSSLLRHSLIHPSIASSEQKRKWLHSTIITLSLYNMINLFWCWSTEFFLRFFRLFLLMGNKQTIEVIEIANGNWLQSNTISKCSTSKIFNCIWIVHSRLLMSIYCITLYHSEDH